MSLMQALRREKQTNGKPWQAEEAEASPYRFQKIKKPFVKFLLTQRNPLFTLA